MPLQTPNRSLAEWDAEIEAEYRRFVGSSKVATRRRRAGRFVGFPWAFLVDVCRSTEGQMALAVAIYIYRRTIICEDKTVTLPAEELAELGVDRKRKREALVKLQSAGLIKVENKASRAVRVTLVWQGI